MGIQAISAENASINKTKNEKQQAVKRVQTEFLSQVSQGKSEKEAFLQSLKAIDEKYNLEKDTVQLSKYETVGAYKCAKFMEPNTALIWLEVIEKAVPIVMNFVDWLLDKLPSSNNKEPQAENIREYSTTA